MLRLPLRLLLNGASEEVEGDAPAAATGRTASMERLAAALGRLAWSSGPPLPLDLIVAKCRLPALVRPGPGGSLARGAVGRRRGLPGFFRLGIVAVAGGRFLGLRGLFVRRRVRGPVGKTGREPGKQGAERKRDGGGTLKKNFAELR